jgi:sugar lactone lactonase YvrE
MSDKAKIIRVDPTSGTAGGEVIIDCENFDTTDPDVCEVLFDETAGGIVALGPKRVLATIPDERGGSSVQITLKSGDERTEPVPFLIGRKLAADLHPVANPAFDPEDGSLFVTRSGSRGEELPVTLFRIDVSGDVIEYSGDIPNPTGIAFSHDAEMFVTSRLDGTVYRVNPFKDAVAFARNLGVATGIAFDSDGVMHVGDRTGTIFRVNGIGEEKQFAQLEPSVSAYHLAFGPDDHLYVTGPTVTSFDCVWRVNKDGEVDVFYKGLGRPQGLAFDREGNLYVAASLRGRRGIVRISPNGQDATIVVAGINLVGLAFGASGDMAVVSIDSVYSVPMQVHGTLLPLS